MIRYQKLGYVELNVTDLQRSRAFYRDVVGLQVVEDGPSGEARFRCSEDHYSVVLRPSQTPGYKRSGWTLENDAQFDALHRTLRDHGVAYEELSAAECAARLLTRATRMVEPHTGATLELYLPSPEMRGGAFTPSHTQIQRLGHVVFNTDEFEPAIRFLSDVMNFRLSDRIGDVLALMRPFPSPFHHGLGLGRRPAKLFNHLNFMVSEIDDIGRAINRFRKTETPVVFGPGKHPASSSVFLYFLDPDGTTLEYSFGMEMFPERDPRAPDTLPPAPESFDIWGGAPDPRTAASGTIERYRIGASKSEGVGR